MDITIGGLDPVDDGDIDGTELFEVQKDALGARMSLEQITKSSVGYIPTVDEKAALAGTSGTPSASNPYVTKEDIEPIYLSNTESSINTNGVVSKTESDINGTPILANTAATYYDMTLPRALLPNETPQLQLRSKIDGTWINVEQCCVPSLFMFFTNWVYVNTSNQTQVYGWGGLAKISSNVIRFQQGAQFISTGNFSGVGSYITRTLANIISAADGYAAWRVRIGK